MGEEGGGMGYSFHLMVEEEKKNKYKQIFFFIYFSSPLPWVSQSEGVLHRDL
jgi:hypothetical protein